METVEYRCVLLQTQSDGVLAHPEVGRYRLPRVRISTATRVAQQLQKAIKAKWQLDVYVLDVWMAPDGFRSCAMAELLTTSTSSQLAVIPCEQLSKTDFLEDEWNLLELSLSHRTKSPCTQPGWIAEAIAWIVHETGHSIHEAENIEQWNAGGGFALLRAQSDVGPCYWLKAVDMPNGHELAITQFLWMLRPECLPKTVAIRNDWNAWITEDAGTPLGDVPEPAELEMAARCMTRLQCATVGRTDELLALGAVDHRLPILRSHIDEVISFLIDAMDRQTSKKVPPLSRDRVRELGDILREACLRLERLNIQDALIHNDLSTGNILSDGKKCVITDWSEAAVGNPFLSCDRLCQLNRLQAIHIQAVYKDCWRRQLSSTCIEEALTLAPLVSIYAYLYRRGTWLKGIENVRPASESYARSLARHMDRAANNLISMEAPCK